MISDITIKLERNIQKIKDLLRMKDLNVPFFIAGGSVFSILQENNNYYDLDVYFYNLSDINLIKTSFEKDAHYVSNNAITIRDPQPVISFYDNWDISSLDNKLTVQFIIKTSGTPYNIIGDFDFNVCRCAFTSDNELIKHDTYSTVIEEPLYYNSDTFGRYLKYCKEKGASDNNYIIAMKIIDYYVENIYTKFDKKYDGFKEFTGLDVLNGRFCSEIVQYYHDKLLSTYNTDELIQLYSEIKGLHYNEVKCPSTEFVVSIQKTEYHGINKFSPELVKQAIYKYPEYYI